MKLELDVTIAEYKAAHDLIAYALRPRAVRDDPESAALMGFFDKLAESRRKAMCMDCGMKRVYARGLCERCYRSQKRRAS